MKKQLSITELEIVLGQMKDLQKQHPTANVVFDSERDQVLITYPLPKEYFKLKEIKVSYEDY